MKSSLTVILLCLGSSLVIAQPSKSNFFLGGTINANNYSDLQGTAPNSSSVSDFTLQPSLGYFINNKSAIGLGVGYSYSSLSIPEMNINNSSNLFSIAPFYRYYLPISEKVVLSVHSQVSVGMGNVNVGGAGGYYIIPDSNSPTSGSVAVSSNATWTALSLSVRPIFIFFPSKRWGIEAGLSSIAYNYSKYPNDLTKKSFLLNAVSIFLGVSYYFIRG